MKKSILGAAILVGLFSCTKDKEGFSFGKNQLPVHYIDSLKGNGWPYPGSDVSDSVSWQVVGTPPTSYMYRLRYTALDFHMDSASFPILITPDTVWHSCTFDNIFLTTYHSQYDTMQLKAFYTSPMYPGYKDSLTISAVVYVP